MAKAALRAGLTPDIVTIVGTAASVVGALTLFPVGELFTGTLVVWFFVLADMLDLGLRGFVVSEPGDGGHDGFAVREIAFPAPEDMAIGLRQRWTEKRP